MGRIALWIRRQLGARLARHGWLPARFAGAAPEPIDSYLAGLSAAGLAPVTVVETDPEPLRLLYAALGADGVRERSPENAEGSALVLDARHLPSLSPQQ